MAAVASPPRNPPEPVVGPDHRSASWTARTGRPAVCAAAPALSPAVCLGWHRTPHPDSTTVHARSCGRRTGCVASRPAPRDRARTRPDHTTQPARQVPGRPPAILGRQPGGMRRLLRRSHAQPDKLSVGSRGPTQQATPHDRERERASTARRDVGWPNSHLGPITAGASDPGPHAQSACSEADRPCSLSPRALRSRPGSRALRHARPRFRTTAHLPDHRTRTCARSSRVTRPAGRRHGPALRSSGSSPRSGPPTASTPPADP